MAIATSEAFLSDVLGAQPWPGQRHMNVESMYEYGSRAGFWRLWRLFAERKLPATVFARRDRAGAPPRSGRGDARSRMGDREPRAEMDRLPGRAGSGRARPPGRGDPHPYRRRPANGRSAGTPAAARSTRSRRCSTTAASSIRRTPMRTTCPIGCNGPKGPHLIDPLHPRRQRHALHQPAGLRQRRGVLRLSARTPSTCSMRKANARRR